MSTEILTAEQFADRLPDLPDGGRWVELEAGVVSVLDLSDAAHGTIVLNLSKRLAEYLAGRRSDPVGYACFELGLIVARDPDTVRRPAVSFFAGGGLFAESDKAVTESVPDLAIETAVYNPLRRAMRSRVADYQRFGVSTVWVVDPGDRCVHVVSRGPGSRAVSANERLTCEPLLPGFSLPVAELFSEPAWWSGKP